MDVPGLLLLLLLLLLFWGATYYWIVVRKQTAVSSSPPPAPAPPLDQVTVESDLAPANGRSAQANVTSFDSAQASPTLQVDVALPKKVVLNQPFLMAVLLRPEGEPSLTLEEVERTQQETPKIEKDAGGFIRLKLRVRSTVCDNVGGDEAELTLLAGRRTAVFPFQLIPRVEGSLTMTVMVAQQSSDDLLGGIEVQTTTVGALEGDADAMIKSQPLGNDFLPEAVSFSQKVLLGEALLRCNCMNEPARRKVVVENLPSNIQTQIGRFANPQTAVNAILNICISKKTGLYHLLEIVRYYEGDSDARWGMEAVIEQVYG